MKKIAIVFIILMIFSCNKRNLQGYRMFNLSGYDVSITTPEGSYFIENKESMFFLSSEKGETNFTYLFSNENAKLKLFYLGTNPERHVNIGSYIYDFKVAVIGKSDSLEIIINGQYFNEKIPFEFGSNSINEYSVLSNPAVKNGEVYTVIYENGYATKKFEHKDGLDCNLTGAVHN